MKRILTLSLIFFLISTFSFAQIRIEKRHYNKGWYVSLKHKKNPVNEKRTADANHVAEKKGLNEILPDTIQKTLTEIRPLSENEKAPVLLTANKENKPLPSAKATPEETKPVSAPAASQIKNAVTAPVKMQQSFARNMKSKTTVKADPGDSFFGYLFDSMRPFFITLGIILGAVALGFLIYGLIVNPVGTLLTILAILIYPIFSC